MSNKSSKSDQTSTGSSLDYMTGIKTDNLLLKKSFLISLAIHAILLIIVFPSAGNVISQAKGDEDIVITQYTPPPKKKEPPKRKVVIKRSSAVIPDPNPDEPEPSQDYVWEDDENSPIAEGDWLFVPEGDQGPIMADGVRVKMPECYNKPYPAYPELARKARIKGVVVLHVVIDTNGRISQARVISSPGAQFGFDGAALDAIKEWKCYPATLGGRKVEIQGTITVNFTLTSSKY